MSIISLTHINSKCNTPWVHVFHNLSFTMLLIFSDYTAEIWNASGVTNWFVCKASYTQTRIYHSWSISCFLRLKLGEGRSHLASGICRQPVYSQGCSTGRGRHLNSVGSVLQPPLAIPSPGVLSSPLITECQRPSSWQPPPFLRTDLKPHSLCSVDGFFSLPPLFTSSPERL